MKLNLSMESVIRTKENMRVIKLKEHRDTKDSLLVVHDRMTETGLSAYWRAVDATFKYNEERREVFLAKKLSQKLSGNVAEQSTVKREGKDQMPTFFKRRHYEESRMGSHKDFQDNRYDVGHYRNACEDCRFNRPNRYLLPHLKHCF